MVYGARDVAMNSIHIRTYLHNNSWFDVNFGNFTDFEYSSEVNDYVFGKLWFDAFISRPFSFN